LALGIWQWQHQQRWWEAAERPVFRAVPCRGMGFLVCFALLAMAKLSASGKSCRAG